MGHVTKPLRPEDPAALGSYTLLGRLGEGGMGVVYLGRSRQGRPVAIKVVRHQHAADPQFSSRFRREVEAARRVPRYCTAAVLDADLDAEQPYLVTEFVDGPTLHAVVARDGPLRGGDLDALAAGVAAALTAIHDAGVIHRDLKPGNVLLPAAGPRVIDFGIARAVDATIQTITGQVLGTPGYMAPEQVRGERLSPAADVFAWGGVVAFAASGSPPFGHTSNAAAAMHRIMSADPDLLGLDGELREIVAAALGKDPGGRPTAGALLDQLVARSASTGTAHNSTVQVLDQAAATPTAVNPPAVALAAAAHEATTPGGGVPPGDPSPQQPQATAQPPAATQPPASLPAAAPKRPAAGRRARRWLLATTLAAALAVATVIYLDPPVLGRPATPTTQAQAASAPDQPPGTGPQSTQPLSTLTVPDLLGQPADDAAATLEGDGLRVVRQPTSATPADAGIVVGSEPAPGATLAPGGTVTLQVGARLEEWFAFHRPDGGTINGGTIVVVDPTGNEREIATGASPDLAPDAGSVVFGFMDGGFTGQLAVAGPDGAGRQQLTQEQGRSVQDPTWSPDASQIAFFTNTGGLYVMGRDGTGRRLVAERSGFEPDWSPDGTRIVFRDGGIQVVATNGTGLQRLAETSQPPVEPSWSPDGGQIAFGTVAGEIYVMNADGGQLRQVRASSSYHPTWSPDGSQIVFVHDENAGVFKAATGPVLTVNPDGSGEAPLRGMLAGGPVRWVWAPEEG